jgi:wyosine [tRNA(Phe)-imidazoG37] synthetase (radical SAM superfamily)
MYLGNRFVYVVLSARAGGLSIGVDLFPDANCNFSCVYCDVHRSGRSASVRLDLEAMEGELSRTLMMARSGQLRELHAYRLLPDELLQLQHVAVSGEGEPTLAPEFAEALQAVIHVRALSGPPFLKLVTITNGTGLDLPQVQQSLRHLTRDDEVWIKLDGGTQAYVNKVNRTNLSLKKILSNILLLGRERPVVIQSLFPEIHGEGPALEEIDQYSKRLLELKDAGAQISLVQIYSANRQATDAYCGHLPLPALSRIAQSVHQVSGLKVQVF